MGSNPTPPANKNTTLWVVFLLCLRNTLDADTSYKVFSGIKIASANAQENAK